MGPASWKPIYISPALRPLAVPLSRLKLHPSNARFHQPRDLADLKRIIARVGQVKPCVIHPTTRVVLAGNGLVRVMRQLGCKQIAAVPFAGDLADAEGYALADNRVAEVSQWDYGMLGAALRGEQKAGHDVTWLGWTEAEMQPLLFAFADADAGDLSTFARNDPQRFTATAEQATTISRAIAALREREDATQSELSDGRALELICADFLA